MTKIHQIVGWFLERALSWYERKLNSQEPIVDTLDKGICFCTNSGCPRYLRHLFIAFREKYICERCQQPMSVEKETRIYSHKGAVFSEVRVEYNYNSRLKKYLSTAIVRDGLVSKRALYVLRTPLIKGKSRALVVAESTLAGLRGRRREDGEKEVLPQTEKILSFDSPREEFLKDCQLLEKSLQESSLACRGKRRWFRKVNS